MTFGIFQDAYNHEVFLHGSKGGTGVIGTTMNGVIYLSMPVLFTVLDRGRWAGYRRSVAVAGVVLSATSFLLSSFSTQVWHLILLQGILAALGNAMLYSPTTLYLDEHFSDGRATAYGAALSSKNITGTGCPLMMSALIQQLGLRWTLRIWAGTVLGTGLLGVFIIPKSPVATRRSPMHVPWSFLKHKTFYIYTFANAVFSSGYSLPQTYLSSFASDVLHLSTLSSSLMITLFNAPGILSCVVMPFLTDRTRLPASASTLISALGSSVCVLLLWGLTSDRRSSLLIAFSICYGFFAGSYSSTWGGWIKDLEQEAIDANEAINTGMLYGFLNGARGIGYVVGGLAGVELLNAGAVRKSNNWSFGTNYGALILYTGISAILGGWAVVWKGCSRRTRR